MDAALASCALTGSARAAERRRIEAQIEADELREAEAAASHAEAMQERARIRSAYRAGVDCGRPLQALRFALSAPLSAAAISQALACLPTDRVADVAATAMPGAASFGGAAAQAERERIRRAFASSEAHGRTKATAALILEDDGEGLTAAQIAPLLASMPVEQSKIWQSLEQRSLDAGDFGADLSGGGHMSKTERSAAMWKRAVAGVNQAAGADAVSQASPSA
ncbi:hypothetical protein [Gemmobacter serpentinus]|uniref:hypothetical protein n=1 Tax=Gemmobacter serpentinus TaxID=2652247 RepID=UPI00124D68A3|nr:hypothetical protein [Gemmobacter serpentinus]